MSTVLESFHSSGLKDMKARAMTPIALFARTALIAVALGLGIATASAQDTETSQETTVHLGHGASIAAPYSVRSPGLSSKVQVVDMKKNGGDVPSITLSVLVKASPRNVWLAIQHQRVSDAAKRTLVSYDGRDAVIEEKFGALPVVGGASCRYCEHETVPNERIDYDFVGSDKFREFKGHWLLKPGKDGKTVVELKNVLDPGLRVPFWQDITRMAATKNVKQRLHEVASYAEQLEQRVGEKAGL